MKKYCLPFCFAIIAFSVEGYSQFDKQITEEQISIEKKKEGLDTISKLLIKNYIFPEMAEKMASMLRQKQTDFNYIETTSFIQFARMINQDLIDISSDKHILIRFIGNANKPLKPCLLYTSGSSVILIYPDEKAVIVLAGNMEDDTMNSVAGKMLQLFLD